VDESGGSGLLSGSHTYAGNGTFPIVVCVVDDDGDGGCDTKELVIRPGVPDLVVEAVDSSGVSGDWQTLEVSGTVSAEVTNRGNADAVGTYSVVFFEDADGNGGYDPGIDLQLGVTTSADLAPGASTIITDTISGTVSFRDNLIYAYVDSEDAILESDETNNVSHSGLGCEFPPVWDLSTDWSDSANPNGVWTYREGSNPLPFIADWTPLGSDSVQPAWSPGAVPGNHLPAWFKSTDIVPGYDFLPGDVVVHSTDFYNGPGRGVANVIWTSPVNATVNISGEVWPVRDIGRENTWRLSLQRESAPIWPLTDGHVADGDPFDRANPFDFATGSGGPSVLNSIAVSAGDEIQLDMIADPEVSGGDFVGVNLTITETECVAPPSGLVGWWPGNGNTDDIVGGNHGTLVGDATFGPGMVGQAFSLDGDGDYVDLGTAVGDFGTGDFTVDLWVNFRDTGPEQVLIEKYVETVSPSRTGWTLTKLASSDPTGPNDLRFATPGAIDPNTAEIVEAGTILAANTWYHVTVTRSSGTFNGYLNGALVDTFTPTVNPDLDSTSSLKLGHRGNPTDTPRSRDTRQFFLNGLIDEVEIFNRALGDGEIEAIYNAGSGGKCLPGSRVAFPDLTASLVRTSTTAIRGLAGSFSAPSRPRSPCNPESTKT
jgi:hypothetical protein